MPEEDTILTEGITPDNESANSPPVEDGKDAGAVDEPSNTPPSEDLLDQPVVPEEYDLKAPEGFEELDSTLTDNFVPFAKEAKLSNEQAQAVVDMYGKGLQSFAAQQQEAWSATLNEWRETSRKDQEIGGVKLDAVVSDARTALNVFGNTALTGVLKDSGLGNHPEVLRFLWKVGQAAKNDNFEFGREQHEAPKTRAQILFPNMN